MAARKALGRGLSALIPPPDQRDAKTRHQRDSGTGQTEAKPAIVQEAEPVVAAEEEGAGAPLHIAISKIAPNPDQPRKQFKEADLTSLAESIRAQGILQPLVVRDRGDFYELIIGERRWRASQLVGLEEVPAVILDATDRQVVEMALVENVQRADLNPIELAEAFRVLIEDEGMTQEQVGKRVGLDRSTVANNLRLLELGSQIQQDVIDGRLTMGHAKAVLTVPAEQRAMMRDQIVRQGLTVRGAEELGRRIASSGGGSKKARTGPSRDVHVVDLEDQLRKELRTKVRVVGRKGRGRIEVHYFGEGELDRLAELLLEAGAAQ